MTAEASAEPPRVEGAILLLVTLGDAAPHPLMVVHVNEAAHGHFRGVVVVSPQDSAPLLAGLPGTDLGEHTSLGALSQHAKAVGDAHLARLRA